MRKRKQSKKIFNIAYIGYVAVLVVLIIICAFGVRNVLKEYEANQPEYQAKAAMEQLVADASSADAFWEKYSLPETSENIYEKNVDVKSKYIKLYTDGELNYTVKSGTYPENEMRYLIRNDKTELAEVVLKSEGDIITKLAVFNSRVWNIESINPIFGPQEYSLQIPDRFTVSANGIPLSAEEGAADENGLVKYTVSGVFMEPTFDISDGNGNNVSYVVKNYRVIPEYYDYTLTIPNTLTVKVNGTVDEGTARENNLVFHEIRSLQKPDVVITDMFGNSVSYEGKGLDLTYMTILAPDSFSVKYKGGELPEGVSKTLVNPDFESLVGLVDGLPNQVEYNIAILEKDADIAVYDSNGNTVELDANEKSHNLMNVEVLQEVPAEIAAEINVLEVAQNWSLYMSNDFSFANISKLMLPNSKQYKVAKDYSTSIDRTFFSNHILLDPAFTENKVSNFTWITEDSFSVQVSFVKHMKLTRTGQFKDDAMNDRFYFVRSNGKWLLAALKEVVVDGQ